MNWKDEIDKHHKGQMGFFKEIENEQKQNTKTVIMKVVEIRKNSLLVITSNGQKLPVAKYQDEAGVYVYNEKLEKEYLISKHGYVYDSTFLGS